MIEVLLTVIILALLGVFVLYVRESNQEKAKLVNALVARNAQELTNLTFADQVKIEPEINKEPDLQPAENLTDEQFDAMIDAQNSENLSEVN